MGTIIKYNSPKSEDSNRIFIAPSTGGYQSISGTTSSSETNVNLWGNNFDGKTDISASLTVNGDIFLTFIPDDFDDTEYTDDDGNNASNLPSGSLYSQNKVEARGSVYGKTLYLDYPEKLADKELLDEDGEPTGEYEQDDSNKKDLLEVLKMIMPIGSIIMHNGSVTKDVLLSYGWAVCDGTNGTPDLTGKFIKGGTTAGATGGTSTVTLTTDNLPSHSHTYNTASSSTSTAGSHSHIITSTEVAVLPSSGINTVGAVNNVSTTNTTGDHTHSITLINSTTSSVGSGSSFNIEPPYYTLIYVMRIK